MTVTAIGILSHSATCQDTTVSVVSDYEPVMVIGNGIGDHAELIRDSNQ
jgi:hypothetical protein